MNNSYAGQMMERKSRKIKAKAKYEIKRRGDKYVILRNLGIRYEGKTRIRMIWIMMMIVFLTTIMLAIMMILIVIMITTMMVIKIIKTINKGKRTKSKTKQKKRRYSKTRNIQRIRERKIKSEIRRFLSQEPT